MSTAKWMTNYRKKVSVMLNDKIFFIKGTDLLKINEILFLMDIEELNNLMKNQSVPIILIGKLNINQTLLKEEIVSEKSTAKKMNKNEWLEIENKAKSYWVIMPNECKGKSSFKEFCFAFNKLGKGRSVPNLWFFYATLCIKTDFWNIGYYPAAHKFLLSECWNDFNEKEKAELFKNQEAYKNQMKRILDKFYNMGGVNNAGN